jgi:hypothetical protein
VGARALAAYPASVWAQLIFPECALARRVCPVSAWALAAWLVSARVTQISRVSGSALAACQTGERLPGAVGRRPAATEAPSCSWRLPRLRVGLKAGVLRAALWASQTARREARLDCQAGAARDEGMVMPVLRRAVVANRTPLSGEGAGASRQGLPREPLWQGCRRSPLVIPDAAHLLAPCLQTAARQVVTQAEGAQRHRSSRQRNVRLRPQARQCSLQEGCRQSYEMDLPVTHRCQSITRSVPQR